MSSIICAHTYVISVSVSVLCMCVISTHTYIYIIYTFTHTSLICIQVRTSPHLYPIYTIVSTCNYQICHTRNYK